MIIWWLRKYYNVLLYTLYLCLSHSITCFVFLPPSSTNHNRSVASAADVINSLLIFGSQAPEVPAATCPLLRVWHNRIYMYLWHFFCNVKPWWKCYCKLNHMIKIENFVYEVRGTFGQFCKWYTDLYVRDSCLLINIKNKGSPSYVSMVGQE